MNIARIGTVYWIYSDAFQWITVHLGLDKYLAMTAATIVTTMIWLAIPWLGWVFLFGKRRTYAFLAIAASMCAVGIVSHFAGKEVNFDRRNGQPLRYYAMTAEGVSYSFSPGFDPKYGAEYKPLTQEVVRNLKESDGQSDKGQMDKPLPAYSSEPPDKLPQRRWTYKAVSEDSFQHNGRDVKLALREIGYAEGKMVPYIQFDACSTDWVAMPVTLRFRKSEQEPLLASWNWEVLLKGGSERCVSDIFLTAKEEPREERNTFNQGVLEIADGKDNDHVLGRIIIKPYSKRASL
ncbi:MAG: hypothetical protein WC750_05780 [Patescibacteria group bacterium]